MKLYFEKWVIFSFVLALTIMLESDILPHHVSQWIGQVPQVTLDCQVLDQAAQTHTVGMNIASHRKYATVQNRPIHAFSVETTRTRLVCTQGSSVTEIMIAKSAQVWDNVCLSDARYIIKPIE